MLAAAKLVQIANPFELAVISMGREQGSDSPHEPNVGDVDKQMKTSVEVKNRSFRTAGFAAFLLLGFALWQSFLSTGIVYGWPSLLNVLQDEGVYSHLCDGTITCAERTVAFNLVFTIGGSINISGAVLCGILVDSCGPRGGILTGLVLIMIGSCLMGFADVESDFIWPLAYAFYGLGGCCVHLSGFSLGNAFGRSKGLVISMLVSVFSISALVFQGFDLLYTAGMRRNQILLLHVGLEVLNFCISGWLWPKYTLSPGTELRCSQCRISSVETSGISSKSTGMGLRDLCRNAWRSALTWKFGCFLLFHFAALSE